MIEMMWQFRDTDRQQERVKKEAVRTNEKDVRNDGSNNGGGYFNSTPTNYFA
jgi:hypothetical protein